MRYKVIWLESTQQAVSRLAAESTRYAEIPTVIRWFEKTLAEAPMTVGESRGDECRVVFRQPLALHCHVDEAQRRVTIDAVWRISD